ncbi:MAG: hypothetical protein MJ064_08075 [Lachnospiraceae bacterium]|nr:hypothetical protein [Lachnospiraceae bacterium]
MPGRMIRLSDFLARKNRNQSIQQPFDEAEAEAAEQAIEEFDKIAANLDEEKMEEYVLEGILGTKHIG